MHKKIILMRFNHKICLVIFLLYMILNGCGQKGPLTLNSLYIEQPEISVNEEEQEEQELTENASNNNP